MMDLVSNSVGLGKLSDFLSPRNEDKSRKWEKIWKSKYLKARKRKDSFEMKRSAGFLQNLGYDADIIQGIDDGEEPKNDENNQN